MNEYHRQLLNEALPQREKEITEYQVNIDNYRRAIGKCEPEMDKFREQLEGLLASAIYEQRKAQIMLEVIKEQLCDS